MFQTTFLGHQGWLFQTATTHVLVDPLLGPGFGHGGLAGVVYPPRRLDLAVFPPIDAVVITHEHDDHFDVPSLDRLDRSIPIHLSVRSSEAAHALLRDMGFGVQPLHAGHELALGDLRYRTFPADHRDGRNGDEWDVFPFLLHDTAGHGSFLCSVDVRPSAELLARLRGLEVRPGLWAYANNSTSAAFQRATPPATAIAGAGDGAGAMRDDDAELERSAWLRVAARRRAEVEQHWGTPVATLVCGGGWSHGGERAWLDHHAFPLSCERLAEALAAPGERMAEVGTALGERRPEVGTALGERRPQLATVPRDRTPEVGTAPASAGLVIAPVPGQTLVMRAGRLVETMERRDFLAVLPRAQWPPRDFRGDGARLSDYAPACSRRELGPGGLERLQTELGDLARYLYGTTVFRSLCSLPTVATGGPRPAMGLALRHGPHGEPLGLRYDPSACAFVPHEGADPIAELMSGLELWATDLLALLDGELGPSAVCYAGRMRSWNHDPRRLWVSPHVLWMFAHPLRRPQAAAALYRRLLTTTPRQASRIPGRRRREGS